MYRLCFIIICIDNTFRVPTYLYWHVFLYASLRILEYLHLTICEAIYLWRLIYGFWIFRIRKDDDFDEIFIKIRFTACLNTWTHIHALKNKFILQFEISRNCFLFTLLDDKNTKRSCRSYAKTFIEQVFETIL